MEALNDAQHRLRFQETSPRLSRAITMADFSHLTLSELRSEASLAKRLATCALEGSSQQQFEEAHLLYTALSAEIFRREAAQPVPF